MLRTLRVHMDKFAVQIMYRVATVNRVKNQMSVRPDVSIFNAVRVNILFHTNYH